MTSPSPHTTASTMTSTVSNLTPLGDPKHGGALFTLPREIRDDIYRLLIKGRYLVFRHIDSERHRATLKERGKTFDKPDLVILQISHVISREAQQILYSEGIFRYSIPVNAYAALKLQHEAINQMKKIEIYFKGLWQRTGCQSTGDPPHSRKCRPAAILEAIIRDISAAKILRDTLHIYLCAFDLETTENLMSRLLPKLRMLTGFRTVVIWVYPENFCGWYEYIKRESSNKVDSNGQITEILGLFTQAIKNAMEETLGPAIICNSSFWTSLEFHPREHITAIL